MFGSILKVVFNVQIIFLYSNNYQHRSPSDWKDQQFGGLGDGLHT